MLGAPFAAPRSAEAPSSPGLASFDGIADSGFAQVGWEHELVDKPVADYTKSASEPLVEEVRLDPNTASFPRKGVKRPGGPRSRVLDSGSCE